MRTAREKQLRLATFWLWDQMFNVMGGTMGIIGSLFEECSGLKCTPKNIRDLVRYAEAFGLRVEARCDRGGVDFFLCRPLQEQPFIRRYLEQPSPAPDWAVAKGPILGSRKGGTR